MLVPTSLRSCSESGDTLVAYNPQRVPRQFGLNQGDEIARGCCWIHKWGSRRFVGQLHFYFLAHPGQTGSPIIRRCTSLARCIETFPEFISPQSVMPRQFALPVTVYARDLYLHTNKDRTSLKMLLDSVNRQQHDAEGGRLQHHLRLCARKPSLLNRGPHGRERIPRAKL